MASFETTPPANPLSFPQGVTFTADEISQALNALDNNSLRTALVQVSSSDILNMRSGTPKELVAAPGAGKMIIIEDILFEMNRTATAYAAGGALEFRYTNGAGAKVSADIAASVVTTGGAGQEYNYVGGVIASFTPVANASVVLTNATAAFTTGTGTARVFVKYRIVNIQ